MNDPSPVQRPALFVLSGPSGAGKDSVICALRSRFADIYYAITVTTRPPRPGEIHGKSYFFVTERQFDQLLDRSELLAVASVHGHRYGAPISEVQSSLEAGKDVLLKVDVQGAAQLRDAVPDAVYIFLAPPSYDDLVERLRRRRTELGSELEQRLRDARLEMDQFPMYDYLVVNREFDLDSAVEAVACIITAERLRIPRRPFVLRKG